MSTTIQIRRGTTWKLVVTYQDSNEDPIDLSGYQIKMQIRPRVDSPIIYATLDSEAADGTITITDIGEITLELTPELTMPIKDGVYDLILTSPAGETTTILYGKIETFIRVTDID